MRGHQEFIIPWLIAATTKYFVVTTAVAISNTTDDVVISDTVATVAVASITIDLLLCRECASHTFFYSLSFVTALKHKEAHKNGNFKEKC